MASCAVNHLLSELSEEDEAVAYQKEWERKSKRRTKLAAQLTLPQAAEIAQSWGLSQKAMNDLSLLAPPNCGSDGTKVKRTIDRASNAPKVRLFLRESSDLCCSSSSGFMPSSMATASSYWCYRCSRFVRVWPQDAIVCPDCDGGFLEEVEIPPPRLSPANESRRRRRIPSDGAAHALGSDGSNAAARPREPSELRYRRNRRASAGDRSPFNPVIVLRGPSDGPRDADRAATTTSSFELFYDDGTGSGLRPLPESISDFLMGSGFDRLLEQLAQIEINGIGRGMGSAHSPASKAAIESMPTIEIVDDHIGRDCHCAVCMDPFELGTDAREMPCKHIYHQDCILPWLSRRNTCPVCRHEMPTDARGRGVAGDEQVAASGNDGETVGLTIWRLPGGGFAVGRFAGSRSAGERELPAVYTEMDGEFNNNGAPRRISWTSRGSEGGGMGRAIRNFFSFFRLSRSASSSSSFSSRPSSESQPSFSRRHEGGSVFRWRSRSRGNAIA
ncbi:hypothetical protein GW17_00004355 [Ensete ventricosum]|nr:hypothetical protein GW17_00004355 [Ensete ventricosum]